MFDVCADLTKEEQLRAWLQNQYKMACEILVEKLHSEDAKLQVPLLWADFFLSTQILALFFNSILSDLFFNSVLSNLKLDSQE